MKAHLLKKRAVAATAISEVEEVANTGAYKKEVSLPVPVPAQPAVVYRLSMENLKHLQRAVQTLVLKAYSKSTIRRYRGELMVFFQALGTIAADRLRTDDVKRYLLKCHREGLKENTLHSPMTYDSDLFMHYYWHDNAVRLRYSAEVLSEKLHELYNEPPKEESDTDLREKRLAVFQSYMMLIGFSIENLIKAVSIRLYTSQGTEIKSFDDLQKNVWKVKFAHDIIEIAVNCNFELSDDERDLVIRHNEFLIWAGRYHIPKHKTNYDSAFTDGKLRMKQGDLKLIASIFEKAEKRLSD